MAPPSQVPRVLRFDLFELDVRAGELRRSGRKLKLQGQPLQVLGALLMRPGELVTREELRAEIWSADTFVDFDHSLHNAIARIRETLGDSAESPRFIETLPRRGYRFIESVAGPTASPTSGPRVEESWSPRIQSLAVLPLNDHSEGRSHEYFADGMTEALITALAKIKALRVISRTSALRYKASRKLLPQIARELNVEAVIEGSVLRSGDRVRIAVQLIQASTDRHLWAESYERDLRDVLALQSEIAKQVAEEVRVILTPEEQEQLGKARRVHPEAHELYLKARYFWNKRTEEGGKKALAHFQGAIDQDPTFAQGYAGIADYYNIVGYYNTLAPSEAYPKAKAAALRAVELDRSLAEPHAALGVVKRDFEWDWAGAKREFDQAVALNPGYVESYHWRSTMLSLQGNTAEAVSEKRKALAMDPLSVVIRTDLARMFYFAREYERAIKQYRAAIEMDPNFYSARVWLAQVYQQKGLFKEAIAEFKAGLDLSNGNTYALAKLGQAYAGAGESGEAQSILQQLENLSGQKYVSPYDMATIYVAWQNIDRAFEWLDKAVADRSVWLGYLNVEPQLDPLRSDPRFSALRERVGLPQVG